MSQALSVHIMQTAHARFSLLLIVLLLLLGQPVLAGETAELSKDVAERLLNDTFLIATYVELTGEKDYVQESNILKAALFGAFDAKARYLAEESEAKEQGTKQPGPVLIQVAGKKLTEDQVINREETPDLFKNIPEEYVTLIRKEAVEVSALYFTGHSVRKHFAPKDENVPFMLNEQGYYVGYEGLGDVPYEPVLKKIEKTGEGYRLTGIIDNLIDDTSEKTVHFQLVLTKGEVEGSWKRQFTEIH